MPPAPGAVKALVSGFNAIAANIAVILLPVALDLFLWLGPRLNANALLAPIMQALPEVRAQVPVEQAKIFTQMLTEFYNGFNIFSVLRTFPLGVFSLMSVNISVKSPLGTRPGLDTGGWLAAIGLILLLTLLGWIAGSFYFRAVSRVALKTTAASGWFHTVLHATLLSGFWMLFFAFANLPLFIFLWLISLLSGLVRTILIVLLAVPISWAVLTIFFSFYGIFSDGQNAFVSTRNSLHMLRYGLPPLGWFTMMALVINQGMDLLWRIPPAESWMAGIGILGHAFISTSLLAASFIYYRELSAWIEDAMQWLKKHHTSSAQA